MPHPEGQGASWSWMTRLGATVDKEAAPDEPKGPQAKVLTVSDSVADGTREDRSGQALVSLLETSGFEVVETSVVPDGIVSVAAALSGMARGFAGVVVSTGGTGFAPRDQTPEATREVIEREAPGLAEAMRFCNPLGRLSRGIAGIKGQAIILNTPGSPRGAAECLGAVIDVLPHALELLGDKPTTHL
jgi:molybdopterin adenylyltransferase